MANQIRLKRASGSDPGASDLVLGEPAVRTDTGEIFLKKDDGSIAKVAGGIDDGDKGDITVSNSGATFTIDSGVIDNANVASNAAIAGSKISPDFGSQNVATTGTLASSDITIQNSNPGIFLLDTNNNDDFSIRGSSGMFRIRSETDAADRLVVNSDGHTDIKGNLDCEAGLDVTGDVTVTSTAPKISLIDTNANDDFEIKVNAGNFAINDATNSVNRFLIDSSGTVDIGGNLDVGAGVDVTGNITVSGTVDGRDVATDGSKLDGIESGATADQTASEILTLIKTVDGSGSGLDADLLDGTSSGSFARSDVEETITGKFEFTSSGSYPLKINGSNDSKILLKGSSNPLIKFQESTTDKATIRWNANGYLLLRNDEDGAQINIQDNLTFSPDSGSNNYKIWHENNDGAGSGLDADTLDGIQGSAFLRSDTSDVMLGTLTIGDGTGNDHEIRIKKADNNVADHIQFFNGSTRVGEIGCQDTTLLRINQVTNTNIYTPRYIRADGGLFVDGTSKGINGSGNFIGGTVTSPTVSVSNGILELKAAIATSHTLTTDYNALAVDPTINNGITVTVPSGAVWAIV